MASVGITPQRKHCNMLPRKLLPSIVAGLSLLSLSTISRSSAFAPLPTRIEKDTLRPKPLLTLSPHTVSAAPRIISRLFSSENDIAEEEYPNDEGFTYASSEQFMPESDVAVAANELAKNSDQVELQTEISNSFMQYALSIILGRALPDARDGLKPVHRRILFAMSQLSLVPSSSHRKCARVVGEVLGKFHPHGDMAVYDALVRMAQDFNSGTPLIDGHGNFGSVDADPAAAMRYTECRLTKVSHQALLEDLQQDTVDFVPNFDGNEMEPTVLPAKLPVLLLNGCSGIAVGMATNVPPHNLNELMDACVALTNSFKKDGTRVSDDELFSLVPAPDFPTGASIMGTQGSKLLYTTGNGGVMMRATTHIEKIVTRKKQSRSAIVVTQLPYQVNKAALLEKIANLVNDKKLDGIADLRDESDRDGIRVVIELKRDAVAAVVLNNLYKKTSLQMSFSGNFLALMGSGTVPQRFTLRSALECFLEFRFETIRRKSRFQLSKVSSRVHIVTGLLKALASVDDVIAVIRTAPDQAAAKEALMKEDENERSSLGLSLEQAEAVLRLQLGQLTRLNKDKLQDEKRTLTQSQKELQNLLDTDDAVRSVMIEEFGELKEKFGRPRRTTIEAEEGGLADIDLIRNSRSVIVVTRGGYIKRMPLKTFESQGRGTRGKKGTSDASTDNEVAQCFTCNDHDTLLMTTQKGVAYGLRAFQVPKGGRTAKGVVLPSVLPIKSDDVITSILPVSEFTNNNEFIVLTTEQGWIKRTPLAAFENLTSGGLIIATLGDGDSLKWCHRCTDHDDLLIGSTQGRATRFQAATLRPTGRRSRGVRAMKLKDGDTIAGMNVVSSSPSSEKDSSEFVLAVTSHGYGKRVSTDEFNTHARGGVGVIAIKFRKNQDDCVSCLRTVREDDEILVISNRGIIVRQLVSVIPAQSRTATGVMVQKLDINNGDRISSVSIVPKYEEKDE